VLSRIKKYDFKDTLWLTNDAFVSEITIREDVTRPPEGEDISLGFINESGCLQSLRNKESESDRLIGGGGYMVHSGILTVR
jgi:hypothetical protein